MSYRSWIASGGNEAAAFAEDDRQRERSRKIGCADALNPGDDIACDNCGEMTRAWEYLPDCTFTRFCRECLARIDDDDPRADRGDFECHQERDQ